jgi:hypothetical protein
MAVPATASAARIELRPGKAPKSTELLYTGGSEVNSPVLQSYEAWYYLQDSKGPATERIPPCEADPEPSGLGVTSRCPGSLSAIGHALIDLGDGDDFGNVDQNTLLWLPVTVLGGSGRDHLSMHSPSRAVLDGGPGDDVITSEGPHQGYSSEGSDIVFGGEGDDEINTRNEQLGHDFIYCGPGFDEVTADGSDEVAADCESVARPPFWGRADGKPVGVTINGAAPFTNDPDVQLTVRAPDAARAVRISNDGGFGGQLTTQVVSTETYGFELASSGPERLPKTVYVRFDGPGLDPHRIFTDDIILDETRPAVRSARLVGRVRGGVRLALRARDATSGVKSAQFARKRGQPRAWIRYRKRITVRRTPHWVRVRDGAGNSSRWHRLRR